MDSFYKFAQENPWLTFFLCLIAGETVIKCFLAVTKIFYRRD